MAKDVQGRGGGAEEARKRRGGGVKERWAGAEARGETGAMKGRLSFALDSERRVTVLSL